MSIVRLKVVAFTFNSNPNKKLKTKKPKYSPERRRVGKSSEGNWPQK